MREREPESPTAVSFNESVATRIMPDKPAERGGSEGGKLDEERQVEAALPAGDTTMKLSSAGGTYGEAKRLAEQLGGDDLAFPTLTVRRTVLSFPFPGRVSRRFGLSEWRVEKSARADKTCHCSQVPASLPSTALRRHGYMLPRRLPRQIEPLFAGAGMEQQAAAGLVYGAAGGGSLQSSAEQGRRLTQLLDRGPEDGGTEEELVPQPPSGAPTAATGGRTAAAQAAAQDVAPAVAKVEG